MRASTLNKQPFKSVSISDNQLANLVVSNQEDLPRINYEPHKNTLFIKGNSTSENVAILYEGAIESINNHFTHADELNLYLYINKFNALTLKCFFEIFKSLQENKKAGKRVKITWFFDLQDQSIIDNAYDFSDLFNLQLRVVPV